MSKEKSTNKSHSESFNQSPSMSILQIKLAGESRHNLRSNHELTINANLENTRKASANAKDVEKSTFDVDVQEKREIFEGKQDDNENKPKFRQGVLRQEVKIWNSLTLFVKSG